MHRSTRFLTGLLALLFAIAAIAIPTASTVAQNASDPAETARIESIVRDYLLKNPEIILEAIQVLEQREQAATNSQRNSAMAALVPTLTASPLTPIAGAENGDVVMVEFFDYQCGYCKRLFPGVKSVMNDDPNLTVIFVEYPVLGPASMVAARAALAAGKQDRYMDMHVALMEHQGRLSDDVIFKKAEKIGLDINLLREDMEAPEITEYLRMIHSLAEGLGIRGTPSMVIGDTFIGGFVPPERLKGVIDAARGEG